MFVFGQPWSLGTVDLPHIATPVKSLCGVCGEEIVDGESGVVMYVFGVPDGPTGQRATTAEHAECNLVQFRGHDLGFCWCTGYDTSSRATARLVWDADGASR